MPELYGNKYKWELRQEINQLKTDLWNEHKEHRQTRQSLDYARCRIAELEAKIERMKQKTQGLLAEANQDVTEATKERFLTPRYKRTA